MEDTSTNLRTFDARPPPKVLPGVRELDRPVEHDGESSGIPTPMRVAAQKHLRFLKDLNGVILLY